jgi:wnt family
LFVHRNLAYTQQLMSTDPLSPESNLFITPPVHPLTRRQLKLVTKNPGTPIAVARAARMAVEECQHQFRSRRWNCPVSESNHGGSIFGKILKKGENSMSYVLNWYDVWPSKLIKMYIGYMKAYHHLHHGPNSSKDLEFICRSYMALFSFRSLSYIFALCFMNKLRCISDVNSRSSVICEDFCGTDWYWS